mmetsp:Transcript_18118/g.30835  ORF Transcript_18118/g.30835 Transcript_18118/m.30835 type:complete len:246 (-) Transcript_18118:380-1117(-)
MLIVIAAWAHGARMNSDTVGTVGAPRATGRHFGLCSACRGPLHPTCKDQSQEDHGLRAAFQLCSPESGAAMCAEGPTRAAWRRPAGYGLLRIRRGGRREEGGGQVSGGWRALRTSRPVALLAARRFVPHHLVHRPARQARGREGGGSASGGWGRRRKGGKRRRWRRRWGWGQHGGRFGQRSDRLRQHRGRPRLRYRTVAYGRLLALLHREVEHLARRSTSHQLGPMHGDARQFAWNVEGPSIFQK